VSPLCHFAAATDVHHDKSEAEIGYSANEYQQLQIIYSCKCIHVSTPFPLPSYTTESDVYEENDKRQKSALQKGERATYEFHNSQFFRNLTISMFKRGDSWIHWIHPSQSQ
jgi:hypothetical protein